MGSNQSSFDDIIKFNNANVNKITLNEFLKELINEKDDTINIIFMISIDNGTWNVFLFDVDEDGNIRYGDGYQEDSLVEFPNNIDSLDDERYSLYKIIQSKYE